MARRSYGVVLLAVLIICAMVMVSVSVMLSPTQSKAKLAVNEGWIAGQVTNGTGPIDNATVLYLLAAGAGQPLGAGWTNASGHYNLTVLGGVSYIVVVFHGAYYTAGGGAAPPVGGTATCDIVMNSIAPVVADVVLTGYVLDGSGNPVPGGNVAGYVLDPLNGGEGFPMYGNVTAINETTGRYTVNVIPGPIGGGVAALGVPGYGFIENQTHESLLSGNTYWLNITLSVPPSTDDATLSGVITDANTGSPLGDVVVTVETSNMFNGGRGYSNFTMTNTTGFYSMNVTNGTGRLFFQKTGYSNYQLENFHIGSGENLVVDATLVAISATIRGNVTDSITGLPIAAAQTFMMDSEGHFTMANTNASGQYVMDAFATSSAWVAAGANGYSRDIMMIEVHTGDNLWIDFGLTPLDSWLTGTITDILTGNPVQGAGVQLHGASFDANIQTNSSGGYNVTLLSGNYSIDINHPNYQPYHSSVQVSPGGNSYDAQMMPMNPAATTKLYGWVNDSESGTGLNGASVRVAMAPPYQSQTIMNSTNESGYYEIMVVPMLLQYVVTNNSHMHAQGFVNATGLSEVRLDIVLDPDPWGPNVTYTQSPTQNISWTNPTIIDATIVEKDPMQFVLAQFMFMNSSAGWSDYAIVKMMYDGFDPLANNGGFSLPYDQVGDTYTFHVEWNGQGDGGWLNNGSAQIYLASFRMTMGMEDYQGVRGLYTNSSMGTQEQGTAWFDNITGDFSFFSFDNGFSQMATPSDPTGVFSPQVSLLRVNDSNGMTMWMDRYPEGDWGVPGLKFVYNSTLPSGRYLTEAACQDFGNRGSGSGTFLTVDNDLPVADAGPDQTVSAGDVTSFDGTGSSDNVGIVNYTWIVDDGGTPVMLWGPNPTFTFLSPGEYNVTLTVTDGAGHTATDVVVIEVGQAIPEFPTIVLPISATIVMVALYRIRRTPEQDE